MNVSSRKKASRNSGVMLIELIAYIGVFVVITGVAGKVFFQSWDENRALQQNSDDVVRVLHVGEEWRADLRRATAPIHNQGETVSIPTEVGMISYYVVNSNLMRANSRSNDVHLLLPKVKTSHFFAENRSGVSAWRWELELMPHRKVPLMKPKFTFEGVGGGVADK